MKTENTPSKSTIKAGEEIYLTTRFGNCSRGKCWGKCFPGQTKARGEFKWVEKNNGTLTLSEPGYYIVGSSDGFSREAKGEFVLTAALLGIEGEIEEQIQKIVISAQKDPSGQVVLASAVGNLPAGASVRRGDLISERERIITELQAKLSAK